MSRLIFRPVVVATAGAALLLLLTACGPATSAGLGEPLEFPVKDSHSGTDGRIAVTIDSIDTADISEFADYELDAGLKDQTPYYVDFSVELLEGEYGDYGYPFSSYQWEADDVDGAPATFVNILGTFDACEGFSSDTGEELGRSGSVTACTIFFAPSSAGLGEIRMDEKKWSVG